MGLFSRKHEHVEPEVVDLREPEPAKPVWGSPVPCPSCAGRGYLDHIDPFREIMFLHCTECATKYQITKAELDFDTPNEAFTL
jgi:hypothetical protein